MPKGYKAIGRGNFKQLQQIFSRFHLKKAADKTMGDVIAEASSSDVELAAVVQLQRDSPTTVTEDEPTSNDQELASSSSDAEDRQLCMSSWVMIECREFLKRTFSFLSAKQLNTCTRVCKVWQKEAKRILLRRQNLNWVTVFGSRLTGSLNDEVSHPLGPFGYGLQQTLEAADSQPKFALMFTEYAKGSDYRSKGTSGPKKSQEVVDYIKSLLPRDCVYLSLMTPGTVGPKSSDTTKPDDESETDGGAICALFPRMAGVDVRILPISPRLLQGGEKEDLWRQWLEAGVSPGDTQCILLFGWGFISGVQQAAMELQRLFQEKARRNPVIAGGIVNRLLTKGLCSKTQESSGVIGVMLSGPNVRAASVLLSEQVSKREEVQSTIATLKEAQLPAKPRHSLGFMFACAGRGRYFYNQDNVESEEFHKVFPDTPLFGLFGGGEIGCRNLTLGREINGMCLQNVAHAYTTIMCLLTFEPS